MIEALRKDKQSMDVYVYTLSRGNQEQDRSVIEVYFRPYCTTKLLQLRLKNQHNYITESALEGRLIYDNEVKLMKCSKILDSATGTGESSELTSGMRRLANNTRLLHRGLDSIIV